MAKSAVVWLGDSGRSEGQKADRGCDWCHCVCLWYKNVDFLFVRRVAEMSARSSLSYRPARATSKECEVAKDE